MLYWLAVAWGVAGGLSLAFASLCFVYALAALGPSVSVKDGEASIVATVAASAVGLVCLTVGALLRVASERNG